MRRPSGKWIATVYTSGSSEPTRVSTKRPPWAGWRSWLELSITDAVFSRRATTRKTPGSRGSPGVLEAERSASDRAALVALVAAEAVGDAALRQAEAVVVLDLGFGILGAEEQAADGGELAVLAVLDLVVVHAGVALGAAAGGAGAVGADVDHPFVLGVDA